MIYEGSLVSDRVVFMEGGHIILNDHPDVLKQAEHQRLDKFIAKAA